MVSRTKSIRQFSDDSLVWGGWMYHNPKKRSEKTEKKSEKRRFNKSHKYWCELHREACFYPRELRFYAKRRNGFQQKDEKVVDTVPLKNDVIKVISGMEYGIPESFKIVTSKAIYIFGTSTPEEAQSWSYAIWKELHGPVEDGIVYNFNVEVQQNRTTQKYNVMGSYLLKVYDDQIKLFTANGKIPTRFKAWIKDIMKASSPPVLCLSLAVLNISTSDVGGDVMVFYADSARDIVRIINHRRHILLGTTPDIEMPQEPIFIDVPVNKYARSQSQPRHISTSVVQSVKSKTNPLKTGSAYSVAASSSPKYHQRKISESFHLFNNTNQGNSVQLKSQSVDDATNSAPDRHGSLTLRPPAPLPRSQASLLHAHVSEPPQQSWSSRDSISSTDSDSSSGYVIDSLVRNSYLKLRSSLNPLDIVYKDPQLDVYTLRRSYHSNSDGESNYSDSELWLSTQQKRFSRKSKRLSQRLSQRSSTVSHPRSISESYPRVSEWTLDFGSDVSDNLSSLKNEFSPRGTTADVNSADVVEKSQPTMFPSSLIPKRFYQEYTDTTAQSRSDPKLNRSNVGHVHVHGQEGFGKEVTEKSDNESNHSDGELWLCAEQKRFSRRSKRMSNKENQKKSPTVTPIKPKVKPPIVPKPKRHFAAGSHGGLGRSVSHDDQRLQNESVTRKPLKLTTGSVDNAANEITVSGEHDYCVIRHMQHIPLPEIPLVNINSKITCPVRKHSHDIKTVADNSGDDELNQSDSEIVLSNVQREFSRRSKKLSSKKRKLQASQNSSDEVKTKSSDSKGSPTKFKPQVTPRTVTKPVVPTRKTTIGCSSDAKLNQETLPHQTSSPNSIHNPDHFWAVDQIASNVASSLLDTHVYSKVTSNGVLSSLPIPMQRNPHLKLSLMNSGSLDDSYSPDHTYNYPYDDSWMGNGEEVYSSDSDIWFGKEIKRLSKRCKRVSKKLQAQETLDNKDVTSSNTKSEFSDEGTAVKATKPNISPRLFKPEARPRKVYKQEESSVSTSHGLNVSHTKSSLHDHYRKRSDELPVLPTASTPILISNLNWSADEDKTYLVNSAMATCSVEDSDEENSGSGYVINTLDYEDDSVYLELESSNHIYSQPIFPMDGLECKIKNDKLEVNYIKTQEMVK